MLNGFLKATPIEGVWRFVFYIPFFKWLNLKKKNSKN